MKPTILLVIALATGMPAAAQRHKLAEVNVETDEGKLLQSIGQ